MPEKAKDERQMTQRFRFEHDGARGYYVIDTQENCAVASYRYTSELNRSIAYTEAKLKTRELNQGDN
jgi:hypothetical protein